MMLACGRWLYRERKEEEEGEGLRAAAERVKVGQWGQLLADA